MLKCDIIIPVWNQLKETSRCVESVRENTKFPYRLIIVDNASDDGTRKYLESLRNNFPDMILERNDKNEGFIKAVNKGIKISDADYICLLNNDTIVTKVWLSEMIDVARSDEKIGIVNPASNNLGQDIPKGMTIDGLAEVLKGKHKGESVGLGTAFGFCMLIKRDVINKVGFFDEIFDMGNFEDTDFCLRAKREGFKIVRSLASYVYHKRSTSFKILKHHDRKFEKNKRIFEERWGKEKRALFIFTAESALNEEVLRKIEKELEKNGWIFIASKDNSANLKDHSRIMKYDYRNAFMPRIVFKVLFKKKRFDEIYCDDKGLFNLLRFLRPVHKAPVTLLTK